MTGPLETETSEASMAAAMTSHTDHQQELPVPRRTIGNAKDSLALRDTTRNHPPHLPPPPQRKTAAHHVGVGSSRRPAARDSLMVRGKNAHETKQLAKEALRQIVAEEEDEDGFDFDDDSTVQEEVKPQEEPDKDEEENAHPLAKLFRKLSSFGEDEKKDSQEAPEDAAADSQEKEAPHSDDVVAGEEEEEDPAGSQEPPAEKRVQFGQVHIHEHAIILGDNPACSEGVPITIDWPCLRVLVRDAQEYDDKKNQQQEQPPSSSSSSARQQETRVRALQQGEQHHGVQEEDDDDAFGEEEACKKDVRSLGATTAVSTSSAGTANRRSLLELKIPPRVRERLVRENQGLSHRDVVRMCRPVNISRHQRLRTVETLQLAPLEQAFQQAKKKFQKPFLSQQERQERQRLKSWRRPSVSGGGAGLHQTCKPIVLDVSNTTRSTLKDDDEDLDADLTEVPQEA